MIDIESRVITEVKNVLADDFPNMPVYSVTNLSPEVFPCISVEESDNYTYKKSSSLSTIENMVEVMYEVNVYSNKANGKKAEAKHIFALTDTVLLNMGFTREYTKPVSLDNGTVYRLVGRYKGFADKN